ncbi:barstar family protein [Micromonospora vinacea]|uniref:barstar family protein n=1 Tax=Micromonospora vinacea TaxID=709878 RepID=UPI003CEBC8D8|nr:barstar family protein [Micromonospora sp. NBC_00855]
MRAELDGRRIRSAAEFHAEIARLFDFGSYCGKNLDALWDRVSFDVERPARLVWNHARDSMNAMGKDRFDEIVAILRRAEECDRNRGEVERFELSIIE